MYKLALKLMVVTAVMTGALLVLSSGGHVAADAAPLPNNCGSSTNTSLPTGGDSGHWGNDSDGEGAGVMASLVMKARDEAGDPLNPHFTLHSSLPPAYDQKQIYQWNGGINGGVGGGAGSVSNTDDWPQHGDFQFGANMSGDGGVQCNGWIVMGPGVDGHVGNGWVLNCHQEGPATLFWFSHLDNPGGAAGTWSMLDANGVTVINDVNAAGSGYKFSVFNGTNERFTFVWHPATGTTCTPATCPGPGCTGSCGPTLNLSCNNYTVGGIVHGYMNAVEFSGTTVDPNNGGNNWVTADQTAAGTSPPLVVNFQAVQQTVSITLHNYQWDSVSKTWDEIGTPYTATFNCYHASCSTPTVTGNGPGGIVLAGQPYSVSVPVTNDNNPAVHPNAQTIPSSVGSYNFQLSGTGGDHATGFGLNPLETRTVTFSLTAPNDIVDISIGFTPQMGPNVLGGGCTAPVRVYQQFSAGLSSSSVLKPTIEHPYQGDDYSTSIKVYNDLSHGVNIPTSSEFYKLSAGGAKSGIAAASNGGAFASSPGGTSTTTLSGHYDITPGSYQAGDEYCAHIHADYTAGYVGPDNGAVYTSGGGDSSNCPRIANEPYFKVYNSGISAGGEFNKCTTDGGTLAGYADISDPDGATRGASSQLSALALIKITGVASAQTSGKITRSPTDLTFANSGVQVDTTGTESPVLGGQFGGCRTLTDETAPTGATNIVGSSTSALPLGGPGSYTHTGNLTITAATLKAGILNDPSHLRQNVSIFVNGDVHISGDIKFGAPKDGVAYPAWTVGQTPSFLLHATGNIYIDPGVKTLAGQYIAEKNSGGGGKIYTCAGPSGFAPMPATNLYSCKNQLVVYGSFVADQINLMRTFGSLRDEEPTVPAVGGSITKNGSDHTACGPISPGTFPCSNDGTSTYSFQEYASTYSLTGLPAASDYHLKINYKNFQGNWPLPSGLSPPYNYDVEVDVNGVKRGSDLSLPGTDSSFDVDLGALPANATITLKWKNNYYGTDIGFIPWNGNQTAYDPNFEINSLEVGPGGPPPSPTPGGPPFTVCSNKGAETDTSACAGEIFQFSPGVYLASPSVQAPSGGSLQLQAITSLPPVL